MCKFVVVSDEELDVSKGCVESGVDRVLFGATSSFLRIREPFVPVEGAVTLAQRMEQAVAATPTPIEDMPGYSDDVVAEETTELFCIGWDMGGYIGKSDKFYRYVRRGAVVWTFCGTNRCAPRSTGFPRDFRGSAGAAQAWVEEEAAKRRTKGYTSKKGDVPGDEPAGREQHGQSQASRQAARQDRRSAAAAVDESVDLTLDVRAGAADFPLRRGLQPRRHPWLRLQRRPVLAHQSRLGGKLGRLLSC